jgi:type VI protein secretion system component Hcp
MSTTWYLAVEGVTGDSLAEGHESELEIGSWNWGLTNERSPNSLAASGRPVLADLVVSVPSTTGTLQLVQFCATGRQADSVVLAGIRDGAGFAFLQYELQRASVSSVTQVTGDNGDLTNQAAFRFRGMTATLITQNPDGSPGATRRIEVGSLTR